MLCPFGFEVGPRDGPWTCPPFEQRGECYCLQACLLYAVGIMDDKIQVVVEFWRPVYQQANNAWTENMPELSEEFLLRDHTPPRGVDE